MHKVFVYGTLRKDERNAHFLKNATCIAEKCWTSGELYGVSESDLKDLDYLEEYTEGSKDNLYERVVQEIKTEYGATSASVYIAARENLLKKQIISGDWKDK